MNGVRLHRAVASKDIAALTHVLNAGYELSDKFYIKCN